MSKVYALIMAAMLAGCSAVITKSDFGGDATDNIYIPYTGTCYSSDRFLIAQGDSWFSYADPETKFITSGDILEDLRNNLYAGDRHFCVVSVATAGKTLAQMNSQVEINKLDRVFASFNKKKIQPEAILLSGGGNDVYPVYATLLRSFDKAWLEYTDSEIEANLAKILDIGAVNNLVADLVDKFVEQSNDIFALERKYLQRQAPVIYHAYDYAVPDGSNVATAWGDIVGPWLEPAFNNDKGRLKDHWVEGRIGYDLPKIRFWRSADALRRLKIAYLANKWVMDEYDEAVKREISNGSRLRGTVYFVDLRSTLSEKGKDPFSLVEGPAWQNKSPYLKYWQNELHPSDTGFAIVASKFIETLDSIHNESVLTAKRSIGN